MNDKILSLLGLCRRAGRLTVGADPTADKITAQKSRLVIMARDISKHTERDVLSNCRAGGVRALKINRTKEQLSAAVGRLCAVASVNDGGFANKLISLISEENEQEVCI